MVTYEQSQSIDDIAVFVEFPYVVIDIDNEETGEIVFNIIEDEDISSKVYKTNRGYHFWFKYEQEELSSVSKVMNALGVEYDIKAWGVKSNGEEKRQYVVLKRDGVWRECIRDCELDKLSELPVFLQQVSSRMIPKYDMYNMKDGDGRNDTLFSYIIMLQKSGMSQIDIKYTMALINDYVFKNPLNSDELNTILRDEAFIEMDTLIDGDVYDFEKGRLRHQNFAPLVSDLLGVKYVNQNYYIYKNGYHQQAELDIERKMIDLIPPLTRNQRSETMDYIKLLTFQDNPPQDALKVNLRNGRLDMQTGELSEHNSRYFDTTRVDITYDPSAYCPITDNMIRKIACHDEELIELIKQMLGYTLVKHNRFQVMFFLYGNKASNGKSTFLNMVTEFLGRDNVSTLSIHDLNHEFKPAELENRLANIGDDVSAGNINESEIFKKVVSGEGVQVSRKFGQPFTLRNYATMLFSGNFLPSFSDKSGGVNRRLVILPFNAKFSREDDDFNPDIEDDITTDLAKSYLLNLALEGYRKIEENKGFIRPKVSDEAFEEFKTSTSTVMMWVEDVGLTIDDFDNGSRDALYTRYHTHSINSGIKHPISRNKFVTEVKEHFGLVVKQQRVDGKRTSIFTQEEE